MKLIALRLSGHPAESLPISTSIRRSACRAPTARLLVCSPPTRPISSSLRSCMSSGRSARLLEADVVVELSQQDELVECARSFALQHRRIQLEKVRGWVRFGALKIESYVVYSPVPPFQCMRCASLKSGRSCDCFLSDIDPVAPCHSQLASFQQDAAPLAVTQQLCF